MRLPRFRLRTVMISIAFLALILTVIVQGVLLQRAAIREQLRQAEVEKFQAEAEMQEAQAEAALQQAQARFREFQATFDQKSKPVQE